MGLSEDLSGDKVSLIFFVDGGEGLSGKWNSIGFWGEKVR